MAGITHASLLCGICFSGILICLFSAVESPGLGDIMVLPWLSRLIVISLCSIGIRLNQLHGGYMKTSLLISTINDCITLKHINIVYRGHSENIRRNLFHMLLWRSISACSVVNQSWTSGELTQSGLFNIISNWQEPPHTSESRWCIKVGLILVQYCRRHVMKNIHTVFVCSVL